MNRLKMACATVVLALTLTADARAFTIGGGAPEPRGRAAMTLMDYFEVALSIIGL